MSCEETIPETSVIGGEYAYRIRHLLPSNRRALPWVTPEQDGAYTLLNSKKVTRCSCLAVYLLSTAAERKFKHAVVAIYKLQYISASSTVCKRDHFVSNAFFSQLAPLMELQTWVKLRPKEGKWHLECRLALNPLLVRLCSWWKFNLDVL